MKRLSLFFLSTILFSGFFIIANNEDCDMLREAFYKNYDPRNLSPEQFKREMKDCREKSEKKGCKQVLFCAAEKSVKFSTKLQRNEDGSIEYSIQEKELNNQLIRDLLSSKERIREYIKKHWESAKKEFHESPRLFVLVSLGLSLLGVS